MASSLVRTWSGAPSSGGTPSVTVTVASTGNNVPVGDVLTVGVLLPTTGLTGTGITDTQGNTYTRQTSTSISTGTGGLFYTLETYVCNVTTQLTGGTDTMTWTNSGGDTFANKGMLIGQWTGLATSSTVDKTATGSNNSGSVSSFSVGPTAATTQAAEMVVTYFATYIGSGGPTTFTHGTGFTDGATQTWGSNQLQQYMEYKHIAATGTQTGAATSSPAVNEYIGAVLTLKDVSTSNTTQDARITGKATSSMTQDVRITGKATNSYTQDVRITGKNTSNTTQDTRLTGKNTGSLTADVRISGKILSNTTQDVRVTGKATSPTTRDIRITGYATSNRTQDARSTGIGKTSSTTGFPLTGLLDNFNRANGALGANWSSPLFPGEPGFTVSNNAALASSTSLSSAYWSAATFGPWTDVWASYGPNADNIYLHARITNPNSSSFSGYAVNFNQTLGQVKFYRVDNTTYTQLGSTITGLTIFDSDVIGLTVRGSTLTAYQNGNSVGSRTDTTYSAAGYIGFEAAGKGGNAAQVDNFGGGTILVLTDVRITGKAIASLAQDVRVTGGIITSSTQNVRVTAKGSATQTQDARIFGILLSNTTQNIRITGRATSSTGYDVRVPAFASPAPLEQLDARVTGYSVATNTQDVRVSGQASSSMTQDVRVSSQLGSNASYFGKLVGEALTYESNDVRVQGQLDSNSTQDARLTGQSVPTTYATIINLKGQASSSYAQSVKLSGKGIGAATQDVRLSAVGHATTTANVKIRAQNSTTITADIRVNGRLEAHDSRSIRVTGRAPGFATYSVRVRGELPSATTQTVKIAGKKYAIAFLDSRVTGKASATTNYAIRVSGKSFASDTRLVHITGYLPSSSKTQDIRLHGAVPLPSSTTQGVRLSGGAHSSAAYDARVLGGQRVNYTQTVKVAGSSRSAAAFDVKVRGNNPYMAQDVRVTGFVRINQRRKFKVATKINKRYDIQTGETSTERSYRL